MVRWDVYGGGVVRWDVYGGGVVRWDAYGEVCVLRGSVVVGRVCVVRVECM